MMMNGIMLGGRFYELVETTDANECCGCAFCERCNVSETTRELPCYLMQRLNPSIRPSVTTSRRCGDYGKKG